VSEAASDVLQILYFKATKGKRLFKMAPLHHHFDWLIGLLAAMIGMALALG